MSDKCAPCPSRLGPPLGSRVRRPESACSRLSFIYGPPSTTRVPIELGGGTGTQATPAPDLRHSAGPSVRKRTGAQATPPVVTAHRSSPAPSAWGCMSSPGGRETRAGTLAHRSDGPKGLAARTRTPRSRGGYRLAGDPAPPASCSGRAQVDASPAHFFEPPIVTTAVPYAFASRTRPWP